MQATTTLAPTLAPALTPAAPLAANAHLLAQPADTRISLAAPKTSGGKPANQSAQQAAATASANNAPASQTPDYWKAACTHLGRKDRVMKKLIAQYGSARLETRGDAFATLARSIVGQQISVKSAQSVWNRFAALATAITAQQVLQLNAQDMRAAGLSARKIEYLYDLARHFDAGHMQTQDWGELSNEAVIAKLTAIRGVGRWTAEMFLIFHMMRPNVLPLDDVGLIKGISQNYFSGEPVSRNEIRELAQAWQPWCSVATWYIWRSLDPLPVAY